MLNLLIQGAVGAGGFLFAIVCVFTIGTEMASMAKKFSWRKKNLSLLWKDLTCFVLATCSMLCGFVILVDAIMRIVLR